MPKKIIFILQSLYKRIYIFFEIINKIPIFAWYFLWFILFIIQLYYLIHYGIDLPLYDEWWSYFPNSPFDIDYLFYHVGVHVVVPTKITMSTNQTFFGLNFNYQRIFNFFLYAFLILTIFSILRISKTKSKILFLIITFYFSGINWWVLYRSDTNAYSFYMLFMVLCIYFLQSFNLKRYFIGLIFYALMMFSFSTGIVSAIVIFIFFSIRIIVLQNKIKYKHLRLLLLFVILILNITIWNIQLAGYPTRHTYPYKKEFWVFLAHLSGWIYGYPYINGFHAFISFVFSVRVILLLFWNSVKQYSYFWQGKGWIVLTFTFCVLSTALQITFGRAEDPPGVAEAAKGAFRYSFFLMFALPGILMGIESILPKTKQRMYLIFFVCFCLFGYSRYLINFNYHYKWMANSVKEGIRCMYTEEFKKTGFCPTIGADDIRPYFEQARRLKLNFTKRPEIKKIQW
ncbi:MAG: hypothetical protein H7A23_18265 [Leptospiraceae bacterium]|nr:hypothetical protein [Leptospiraceae bacterium]MCP5496495.1 hypothetical protein [Leptospiraceae bacterium]